MVPEFRLALAKLYRGGITLALKILEMIGHALSPEDPSYFVRKHKKIGIGCEENYSSARVLHYPPLPSSLDHVQVTNKGPYPLSPSLDQVQEWQVIKRPRPVPPLSPSLD